MGQGTYTSITCTHDLGRHGSVVIASNLHPPGAVVLLWARPKQTVPYQPVDNQRINFPAVFCALLLLASGDIKLNSGPNMSSLSIGCLNICSAVNKVGCIHNTIADFKLDVLALCETRIHDADPPTVKSIIAPQGFSVLHVHRDPTASRPAGGGLAVIYRDQLGVRPLPIQRCRQRSRRSSTSWSASCSLSRHLPSPTSTNHQALLSVVSTMN